MGGAGRSHPIRLAIVQAAPEELPTPSGVREIPTLQRALRRYDWQPVQSAAPQVTAMDMQVDVTHADATSASPTILAHSWLYPQIQRGAGQSIHPKTSRSQKWGRGHGMLAAAVGLLSAGLSTRLLVVEIATARAFERIRTYF